MIYRWYWHDWYPKVLILFQGKMYEKLLLAAATVLFLHIGIVNSQDQQYNFNQGRKLFEEP
jgi:hypothetical protein